MIKFKLTKLQMQRDNPSVENSLKKSISPYKSPSKMPEIKSGFTEDEIEELKEAFNLFDTECKGFIDPKELKAAMQSLGFIYLGFDAKNPIIFNIISSMDTGEYENGINFDQFIQTLSAKLGDKESKEGIANIFSLFDTDKNVL